MLTGGAKKKKKSPIKNEQTGRKGCLESNEIRAEQINGKALECKLGRAPRLSQGEDERVRSLAGTDGKIKSVTFRQERSTSPSRPSCVQV